MTCFRVEIKISSSAIGTIHLSSSDKLLYDTLAATAGQSETLCAAPDVDGTKDKSTV